MSFSTGVVLSDLSDYISPSQACVKPVGAASAEEEKKKLKVSSLHYFVVLWYLSVIIRFFLSPLFSPLELFL